MHDNERLDPAYLQHVRNRTRIIKKPIAGIVSGYHKLPYVLIAPDSTNDKWSVEIRGKIHVSPKLVITPNPNHPTFAELFGTEMINAQLSTRMFSFLYTNRYNNLKIENEDFHIEKSEENQETKTAQTMEELMRHELINTAVISCPDVNYYPVSLERFIQEILEREFNVQ
jgi:hypothetical protein